MKRRKGDRDGGGNPGWYRSIPVNTTGWPTCSKCGTHVSIVDRETGECLRCKWERRKREANSAA